jgi:hypothetical protein
MQAGQWMSGRFDWKSVVVLGNAQIQKSKNSDELLQFPVQLIHTDFHNY